MPKISAPTVQEHRKLMNERLVDAAESILREQGVGGLTAGAVAKKAGIARNSIYRYVDSVDDLRLRVLERNAPKWRAEVFGSLDMSEPPLDRLIEFARASVERSAGETSHSWLMDLYRTPGHGAGSGDAHGHAGAVRAHGASGADGAVRGGARAGGDARGPLSVPGDPDRACAREARTDTPRDHAAHDVTNVHLFITNFLQECWEELGVPAPEVRTRLTLVLIFQSFKLVDAGADITQTADALEGAIRGMAA